MATWTNITPAKTFTRTSTSGALTGGVTTYYEKITRDSDNVVVMVIPLGIGPNAYLLGEASPSTYCSQLGFSYSSVAQQAAFQSYQRAYWTGSAWSNRSLSNEQTTMAIYCVAPASW